MSGHQQIQLFRPILLYIRLLDFDSNEKYEKKTDHRTAEFQYFPWHKCVPNSNISCSSWYLPIHPRLGISLWSLGIYFHFSFCSGQKKFFTPVKSIAIQWSESKTTFINTSTYIHNNYYSWFYYFFTVIVDIHYSSNILRRGTSRSNCLISSESWSKVQFRPIYMKHYTFTYEQKPLWYSLCPTQIYITHLIIQFSYFEFQIRDW